MYIWQVKTIFPLGDNAADIGLGEGDGVIETVGEGEGEGDGVGVNEIVGEIDGDGESPIVAVASIGTEEMGWVGLSLNS